MESMITKSTTILSNGYHLHVDANSPEKYEKLVVTLTGDGKSGSKSSTWTRLIPALVEKGMCVVSFDFQGLGDSEGVYEELSLSAGIQNFKDVLNYIRSFYSGSIYAVGASFGGAVLLNSVCKGIVAPACMVFKSPATLLYKGYESEQENEMVQWKKTGISSITGQKYSIYEDSLLYDPYKKIDMITCPTLIIHGDRDSVVPVDLSIRLAELNRNIRLHLLPGVDHDYKQNDALNKFVQECVEFIDEH